jgi:hypothetical protein
MKRRRLPLGATMPDNRRIVYDQRPKGIVVVGDSTPDFPEEFQRKLQGFDRDLLVAWHQPPFVRKPGRWKIERCIRHFGKGFDVTGRPLHDHTCERVYVLMCQDDEDTPMPLGDWLFVKLGEMRHNWETLGGDTERGIQNAIAQSNSVEQEMQQKREQASVDMISYNRKDKRFQINKLLHLIQQHDVAPN